MMTNEITAFAERAERMLLDRNAEIERLRAALTTLSLDLASCACIYPGAVGVSFKSASEYASGIITQPTITKDKHESD